MTHLNGDDNNGEEETPTVRDLSVTVTDGTDAISGVTVAIGEITGTTGQAGGCTLKDVADGEHTITATREGYNEYSATITSNAENTSFTITLTAVSNGG